VRTGSHGATDLSPVCMAAALHFDLAGHNFGIQEYMRHTTRPTGCSRTPYKFGDGALHPGEAPGWASTSTRRWREAPVRSRLPADGAQAGRHRAQLVT
jgi:L-alanine-DL-glutamate epimerase-like enolase superfamily enzyme